MSGEILLSTAYFPPAEYFSLIANASNVIIEKEENYIKQTYRNRCKILSANGIQTLSIPILKGITEKSKIKDIEIDYSKKWQQVHIRALISSYSRSPYFQYYFEIFEKIILENNKFLFDLNTKLLKCCLDIIRINKCIEYTYIYIQEGKVSNDYRYSITPKKISTYHSGKYIQVFEQKKYVNGLSILDLIFNVGPETSAYL
jgi:hypothetical protein